ncbi:MAG TPA: hypothetical protein VNA67_02170 [Pseudonocardiaceae bacterium]|nr:hypothetical protein [Pseudonocardiaceae bacterium]
MLLHANRSHEASTFTTNVPGCRLIGALTGTGSALPQPVLALAGTASAGVDPAEPQTEVWTKSALEYPTLGEQRRERAKRARTK